MSRIGSSPRRRGMRVLTNATIGWTACLGSSAGPTQMSVSPVGGASACT
jgi:hypothetical protein